MRRLGALHAAANTAALGLYVGSLAARASGRGGLGRVLSYAGLGLATGSAAIGGHMSYAQSSGVSHAATAARTLTTDWIDLGPLDDLPEGRPALRTGTGGSVAVPLAAVRRGARVDVFVGACSHLSGPLDEGVVEEVRGRAVPGLPVARLGVRPRQRLAAAGPGGQRAGEARGAHGGRTRDGPPAGSLPLSAGVVLGWRAMRRTAIALAGVVALLAACGDTGSGTSEASSPTTRFGGSGAGRPGDGGRDRAAAHRRGHRRSGAGAAHRHRRHARSRSPPWRCDSPGFVPEPPTAISAVYAPGRVDRPDGAVR